MKVFLSVALCLYFIGAGLAARSLPKDFQKCKRNDNACLKVAIQKAFPIMAKGLPKLGVLPIDPLRVTRIFIDQGQGSVSLKLTLLNQDLLGIGQATVLDVRSDMTDDTYMTAVDVLIPTFVLRGDYMVDGRVLILPLQGRGKDNLTLTDLTATVITTGHVVERNNDKYIEVDNLDFKFNTTRLFIELENLFNGDRTVGDHMIVFLNENWKVVLDELKPGIQDALGEVFRQIHRQFYSKIPYGVLHPSQ